MYISALCMDTFLMQSKQLNCHVTDVLQMCYHSCFNLMVYN